MNEFWETELTDEESEGLIEKAAEQIIRRGMQVPAILFLELHKPLSNVAAHAAVSFSPFLVPFLGFDQMNDYSRLFRKRENVEKLIVRLESSARPAPKEIKA